MDKVVIQLFTR